MRIALLGALLVGCGGPVAEPDVVTKRGVSVYLHGLTLGELDAMDSTLAAKDPAAAERCLSGLTVGVFSASDFENVAEWHHLPRSTGGLLDANVAKSAWASDPWETAYVHEGIHWLQRCAYGVDDYAHEAAIWK